VAALGAAPVYADAIGDAAKKLSSAAYPLLKDVDWRSTLALTKPGSAKASEYLTAVGAAIDMGAAMDPNLLKAGVEAHHKAIGSADVFFSVTSKQDFEAINAALGRMIASVPESKVMAVYDAFSKVVSPDSVCENSRRSKIRSTPLRVSSFVSYLQREWCSQRQVAEGEE